MAPGHPGAQRNQFRSQTQSGGQLNSEFQQFAQATPAQSSFEQQHFSQQFGQPQMHQPQMHGQPQSQHGQADWAQSFSQLNIGPQAQQGGPQTQNWGQDFARGGGPQQQHHVQPQMASGGMMGMGASMGSFGPMYSNSQLMNSTYGLQAEHQQTHKTETKSAQDAAFEAAFGAVEQSMAPQTQDKGKETAKDPLEQTYKYNQAEALNRQAEHISDNITEEKMDLQADENGEFASIARQIASSLEEADKSKFEKSSFMNLMRRIGNHEVTIDGDKLVNKDGEDIREEIKQELQREGATQENGFQSEAQNIPLTHTHQNHDMPPQPEHVMPQDQPQGKELEDPMVFIEQESARRAAESGRTVEEEKLNFYSPFDYAQRLGPQGVAKQSNWEEDYDF